MKYKTVAYTVTVSYPTKIYNPDKMDNRLVRTADRLELTSGTDYPSGTRELEFEFVKRKSAYATTAIFRKIKHVRAKITQIVR